MLFDGEPIVRSSLNNRTLCAQFPITDLDSIPKLGLGSAENVRKNIEDASMVIVSVSDRICHRQVKDGPKEHGLCDGGLIVRSSLYLMIDRRSLQQRTVHSISRRRYQRHTQAGLGFAESVKKGIEHVAVVRHRERE